MSRQCEIKGCNNAHYGKGYCKMHWYRVYRYGTIETKLLYTAQEKLESSYIPEPESGCWLWTGGYLKGGYGFVRIKGKGMSAHRASWEFNRGAIPEDMHVLHKCDTPECINPNHLFLGTHADNMGDASRKGKFKNNGRKNNANKL